MFSVVGSFDGTCGDSDTELATSVVVVGTIIACIKTELGIIIADRATYRDKLFEVRLLVSPKI